MTDKPFYSAQDYPIGDSVNALIRRVKMSMSRCIEADMARHGLTDAQWGPLLLIRHDLGRTAARLAELLDVDPGAMTRTIDRLEHKGLVRRERSGEDRREVILDLTAEGEEAAARVPVVLAAANNAHLAGFTDEEFAMLRALLQRMADNGARLQAEAQASVNRAGEPFAPQRED
ncbi:MAG: hypothetical protein RIS35_2603 [Pseudomonadota bacterium]